MNKMMEGFFGLINVCKENESKLLLLEFLQEMICQMFKKLLEPYLYSVYDFLHL